MAPCLEACRGGILFFQWFAQRAWRGFGFFNGLPNGPGGDSFLSTGSPNGSGRVSDFIFNGLPNRSAG